MRFGVPTVVGAASRGMIPRRLCIKDARRKKNSLRHNARKEQRKEENQEEGEEEEG